MRLAMTLVVALTVLPMTPLTTTLSAQRGGGGGGDFGDGGGFGGGAVVKSPFDRLVDELDLEKKVQVPAVAAILGGVESEAAALFQELVARRQDLLNAATNKSTDQAPGMAYTTAVTKLIALEARVFQQIYAQLTPKQKEKAAKGYDRLETLFKATLSTPGARSGGGRGGPGRGMPPAGGGR